MLWMFFILDLKPLRTISQPPFAVNSLSLYVFKTAFLTHKQKQHNAPHAWATHAAL